MASNDGYLRGVPSDADLDDGRLYPEGADSGVDDPETRLTRWDGDEWQPEDTYHESVGVIDFLIEDAAAVVDDSETRPAIWDETPEVDVDEPYQQDQYTEPIGGPETYVELVGDFHEEEPQDVSALADAQEDSLEGIVALQAQDEEIVDVVDGEIPQQVEDVAAPADDPEARVALQPQDEEIVDVVDGEIPQQVEDAAAPPADDPEARVALADDGSEEEYPDTGSTSEQVEDAAPEPVYPIWDTGQGKAGGGRRQGIRVQTQTDPAPAGGTSAAAVRADSSCSCSSSGAIAGAARSCENVSDGGAAPSGHGVVCGTEVAATCTDGVAICPPQVRLRIGGGRVRVNAGVQVAVGETGTAAEGDAFARAKGIKNPSDEEIVALVLTIIRKRRLTRSKRGA